VLNNFILAYIERRMQELGYRNYHVEPVRITSSTGELSIQAYNEYYYLVAKTVKADLLIVSDTNVFNEGATYSDFQYYGHQEFSGDIQLKQIDPIDYEFIRVTPKHH